MSTILYVLIGLFAIGWVIETIDDKKREKRDKEDEAKRAAQAKVDSKIYKMKTANEILAQCWNSNTKEFDLYKWSDRKYEILYDASDLEIRKYVRSDVRSMLGSQILLINTFLRGMQTTDVSRSAQIRRDIKTRTDTVAGLTAMLDIPDPCPDATLKRAVAQYQQDLFVYILHERETLTQSKLADMLRRGDALVKQL